MNDLAAFLAARLDEDEPRAVRLQSLRAMLDDPHRQMDRNTRSHPGYQLHPVLDIQFGTAATL
jgi:hypothetical protein